MSDNEKNSKAINAMIAKEESKRRNKDKSKIIAADIGYFLIPLPKNDTIELFWKIPQQYKSLVFPYLHLEEQEEIFGMMDAKEVGELVNKVFIDDIADLIESLTSEQVETLLSNVNAQTKLKIQNVLNYEKDTGGNVMAVEFVEITEDMTVKQAIAQIKKSEAEKETVYNSYVVDSERKLVGRVTLRTLLVSKESDLIGTVMTSPTIFATTSDDQENIARLIKKYDLISIPIVDENHVISGIVTFDDAIDILTQESTEDIQKMAAMTPEERPYLKTGVFSMAKHRITWLLILMISGTLTGLIIEKYNVVLSSVLILASYIPMLMDSGGNSGSQASTMVIRGLAIGEIKPTDFLKVLWKEFRVSLLCGFVLALFNFIRMLIIPSPDTTVTVALVVNITMFLVVIFSKVVGGMLPILAKKVKLDPAVMASPLITTLVDAMALIVYFWIASALLL